MSFYSLSRNASEETRCVTITSNGFEDDCLFHCLPLYVDNTSIVLPRYLGEAISTNDFQPVTLTSAQNQNGKKVPKKKRKERKKESHIQLWTQK